MGKFKDLSMDIEDMILNGYSYDDIALILEIPIKLVIDQGIRMDQEVEDAIINHEASFL